MKKIIPPVDFVNEVGLKIAKEIYFFSPQLFYRRFDSKNIPSVALRSSILFTTNGRFFLVTAAHLFFAEIYEKDIDVNRIEIAIGNEYHKLGGILVTCDPNGDDIYDPDKIDTAVFELDNDTANSITKKYQFLPWIKIHFGHESSAVLKYLIVGYPQAYTKLYYPDKAVISTPFVLAATGADHQYYLQEGIDENKIIVLPIKKDNAELPKLEGISGCGVWIVSSLGSERPEYKLVSIVTGSDKDSLTLYSIRIEAIRMILSKRFSISDI
jgi:hypothetical protein